VADNVGITPGSGDKAASRSVTYSGETAQVQIVGLSVVSGPDDAKTVEDVSAAAPLPVRMDQGPGALVTENGALRVDPTQVNEQAQEVLNATGLKSLGDEPLQMVGLHPSFPLPIDTAMPMPVAGRDPVGAQRQVSVNANGEIIVAAPSDASGVEKSFARLSYATVGLPQFDVYDTKGYAAAFILYEKGGNNFVGVEFSNNRTNWVQGLWYVTSGIVNSGTGTWQYGINPSGTYNIIVPCYARYMRFASNVGSAEATAFTVTLKAVCSVPIPITGQVVASNITQIAGTAVSTGFAQLGVNAFGPTAPNAAHSTNNPVQISGSDGTFVRRILTDVAGNTQVVGGLVAGASALLSTTGVRPVQQGVLDGEGRVRHVVGTPRGQINVRQDDATTTSEAGVIDALNDVVRELKLLNARIGDLPYWLGVGAAMPDDASTFRDDPYLFNQ